MTRIRQVLGFICMALIASCGEGSGAPQDIASEINNMLVAGQTVRAEQLCKEAIRHAPRDPALRLLYGDIYLAAENGQNAGIAFSKAIELGADVAKVQTRLARALLLQRKYLAVLALDAPESALGESVQMEMAVIRMRAELNLPGGDRANLLSTAKSLISSLDAASDTKPWVVALREELDSIRDSSALIASAYEHARCHRVPTESYFNYTAEASNETEDNVIRVGATRSIKTPGEAAKVASDGTVVLIDAGEYPGGVAHWPQDNITIIGVGGRPHIKAAGMAIENRDIWLFEGNNVVVENMEFSGARSSKSQNGAGIRHVGANLIVRHSFFHDSDNGILTWKAPNGQITIEFSEFARNGYGDGQSHNVYIGRTGRLTFRYNYSHAAKDGHLLKSRARRNDISYNRLTGEEGNVSYVIDLPDGGIAYIVGNEIEKAVESRNPYVISFGQEGLTSDVNRLFVVNNSIYNRYDKTILVRNTSETPTIIANNLIGGAPVGLVTGEYKAAGNQAFPSHGMVDPRELNFALGDIASAIDSGVELEDVSAGLPVIPVAEYVHPVSMRARSLVAQLDIGAHEYCADGASADASSIGRN